MKAPSSATPQKEKTLGERVAHLVRTTPETLPALSTERGFTWFSALLEKYPKDAQTYLETQRDVYLKENVLMRLIKLKPFYTHSENLSVLLDIAKKQNQHGQNQDRFLNTIFLTLNSLDLPESTNEECIRKIVDFIEEPRRFRYYLVSAITYLDQLYLYPSDNSIMLRRKHEVTESWVNILMNIKAFKPELLETQGNEPNLLVRACQMMDENHDDNPGIPNETPEHLILDVMLRSGFSGSTALEDPRVSDYSRAAIQRHPLCIKERLFHVAEKQQAGTSSLQRLKL